MTDDIWQRDEVQSPCVKLCSIHPTEGICVGCYRSLDEIAAWSMMPATDRQALLDALPGRADRLKQRRGGRRARQAKA